jgi:hypothetical protein
MRKWVGLAPAALRFMLAGLLFAICLDFGLCRLVYAVRVKGLFAVLLAFVPISACAQTPTSRPSEAPKFDSKHLPRFEDFPVFDNRNRPPAPLKLTTRSERMFRTRLTNASKNPPNFAGHLQFVEWGCGANCISGAVIDLQDGTVFSPPLATATAHFSVCQSAYENSGVEHHVDSRLFILQCGLNYSERLEKNIPDVYYFVWEDSRFRQILHISEKHSGR